MGSHGTPLGHRLSSTSVSSFPFMHLPDTSGASKLRKILGAMHSRNNIIDKAQ